MKSILPLALRTSWRTSWLTYGLAVLLTGPTAWAVLGEDAISVSTTADAMVSTRHEIRTESGLTVHHLLSQGTEIREYVAESTGKVVGVAWTGMREPKRIDALLGSLFSEYVHELKQDRDRRNSARLRLRSPATSVRSAHLVIDRFARMGFSRARVYLTELPSGVSPDAIR